MLLGTLPASATVFVRPSDAELFDQSAVIVEGRVLSVTLPPGPALEYRVAIESPIRGLEGASTLRLRVPGGPDQGAWWYVVGAPRFAPGDSLLLFLTPRVDGSYDLSQFLLGVFHIVPGPSGPMAIRDLSQAHEIFLPGRPVVDDGPRDLEAFLAWLRDRAAGIDRAMDYFIGPSISPSWVTPLRSTHRALPGGTPGDDFQTIFSTGDPSPLGCGANGGHGVRWFDFDTGDWVAWRAYFSGQPGLPGAGLAELRQALDAWSSTSRPVAMFFDGLTTATDGLSSIDGINTVLFDDPNDEIGGSWSGAGVLAIGGPWFRCDLIDHQGVEFHPVVEGDIVTQDGLASFFANGAASSAAAAELFAHELGHTLGFAHSLDPEALMYAELHDDGRGAALSADELAGLDFLYGVTVAQPPVAPIDLVAEVETARRIRLAWSDQSGDENGFEIERRTDGPWNLVGNAARNAESWIDATVQPGVEYGYRLRALNGAGTSPYTAEVRVTTPEETPPLTPTHLRVAPLSSSRLRLTWQDNAENELGYRIELLAAGGGDEFVEIPVPLDTNTRTVILSGLEAGETYSVRVRAFNAAGSSEPSNLVTVSTFPEGNLCEVGAENLCLLDGRFDVRMKFRNQHGDGEERTGFSLPDSDGTGFFWFFEPGNLEVVVKMIDGRSFNGRYWVYLGGISDLDYEVTVTDTYTGERLVHRNPPGALCGLAEIEAFVGVDGEGTGAGAAAGNADSHQALAFPTRPAADLGHSMALDPHTVGVEVVTDLVPSDPASPISQLAASTNAALATTPAGTTAVVPTKTDGPGCQRGPNTLCLLDGRLQLEVSWANPYVADVSGVGEVIELSETSGMFWFFDPRSIELIVKAVDGSGVNGHLWLFYGALTDVEYWITATDTLTGTTRSYYNPPGNLCGRADIEALASDPPPDPPIQP